MVLLVDLSPAEKARVSYETSVFLRDVGEALIASGFRRMSVSIVDSRYTWCYGNDDGRRIMVSGWQGIGKNDKHPKCVLWFSDSHTQLRVPVDPEHSTELTVAHHNAVMHALSDFILEVITSSSWLPP